MSGMVDIFIVFSTAFLTTFFLIPLLSAFAVKFNIVDVPDGTIKRHKSPTPYLGGVAVYLGLLAPLWLLMPFNRSFLLVLYLSLFLFLGLIDDIYILKPFQKFIGQIVITAGLLFFFPSLFQFSPLVLGIIGFWIVSIVNAFNLVDVMDGLASTIALFSASTFFVISLYCHNQEVSFLLISFIAALLAYLYYNLPPACIYLGDAGSLFLGSFLAVIPFFLLTELSRSFFYTIPFIILGIPLLELVFLILIRYKKGISFYKGSPDHFSCYLKNKGWSVGAILAYISFLSLVIGLSSTLFFLNLMTFFHIVIIGFLFILQWTAVVLL